LVEELKAELLGSFLLFVQTFFPLVTGKPFIISNPPGRESHFITIARELTLVARMKCNALNINVPPGSGKSTLLAMFTAWTMAKFQNSQYLYISYSHELASKHTAFIKQIIECRQYKELFGIKVRSDSRAKDFFQTEQGASVKAFGSSGSITGQDAGLPHSEHFTGCVIMDDCHKPGEVHSDTVRQSVIQNYRETILQRPRAPNVPMIYIGQRLHEDDLPAYLLSGKDVRVWKPVVLKALDEAGNALYPEVNPLSQLLEQQEKNPYVFASQYQQNPIPAGGALFKPENFVLLDEEPEMLLTFITADTAETNKSYNDATAFSFWGLYEIEEMGIKTGQTGLHSLDSIELRIEPKDLRAEFMSFYGDCMLHKTKPLIAAIEKKSTGVTLCSVLQDMRGLSIREVKRTKASGSKTDRYLEMQPIIASKLVSFTKGAKHADPFITHMMKITANDTHRHDDLCDTMYDAIKLTLIDKTLTISHNQDGSHIVKSMAQEMNTRLLARTRAYGNQGQTRW
jgi:predicted phage terminase large subunit-like protein